MIQARTPTQLFHKEDLLMTLRITQSTCVETDEMLRKQMDLVIFAGSTKFPQTNRTESDFNSTLLLLLHPNYARRCARVKETRLVNRESD